MQKTTKATLVRQNRRLVKRLHPELARADLTMLSHLTRTLSLSISHCEFYT